MPSGNYTYQASLKGFKPGNYFTVMTSAAAVSVNKTVLTNE